MPSCRKLRPEGLFAGKQGFTYNEGISAEPVGAQAIYCIAGTSRMFWGQELENVMKIGPGDLLCSPADMPHLPMNIGDLPTTAVISRTDPQDQERVTLVPDLEHLVS